jgi:flagellar biosynthesis component FlhA
MRRPLNRPKGAGAAVIWDLLTFEHLLTSPPIRPYVRSIIERFRSQTVVLSQNEIHVRAKLRTVDSV